MLNEEDGMELTINGEVYNFKFGIAFLRDIDKTQTEKLPNGTERKVGFAYAVAEIMDGNILALSDVLVLANATEDKRVSREDLEAYLEDDNTNIDTVFDDVLRFLNKSNACKKQMQAMQKVIKENATGEDVIAYPIPEK